MHGLVREVSRVSFPLIGTVRSQLKETEPFDIFTKIYGITSVEVHGNGVFIDQNYEFNIPVHKVWCLEVLIPVNLPIFPHTNEKRNALPQLLQLRHEP